MNLALLTLAFVATVNPARVRRTLSGEKPQILLGGALIVFTATVALAAVADDLLSGLDISPETFRVAAGLIIGLWGLWTMVIPPPENPPAPEGVRAVLVPVAFPVLFTPPLAALAVTTGSGEPVGEVVTALVVGLAAAVVGKVPPEGREIDRTVTVWLARLLAALMVVVAVVLMVDGIRDV